MEKDIYIRFDWAMKRMLRDKANFGVLEGLLTVLLNDKITIVELLESEFEREGRSYFKVLNEKDEIFVVEVESVKDINLYDYKFQGSKTRILHRLNLNDDFGRIEKVVSIAILNSHLNLGRDYIYRLEATPIGMNTYDKLQLTDKEWNALLSSSVFFMPECYIVCVNQFNDVAKTPLEQWVSYLKTGEILDSYTDPGLDVARKRINYENLNEEERKDYELYIKELNIMEGRLQERERLVNNMRGAGLTDDTIASITGLSDISVKSIK